MALTPDPRNATLERLNMLRANRTIVIHALKQMVSNSDHNNGLEDDNAKSEDKLNTNTAMTQKVSDNVKLDSIDMEVEDEQDDLKSMEQINELEKNIKQALDKVPASDSDIQASNKFHENISHVIDSSVSLKGTNISGLSTPPKPRRATNSRTNSLESNGTGVAPGSPFQNNPLLVSHDYSKSPMLIDQDNEETQEDITANEDAMEGIEIDAKDSTIQTKSVIDNDNIITCGVDENVSTSESGEMTKLKQEKTMNEDVPKSERNITKINEHLSEENVDIKQDSVNIDKKEYETNDVSLFDPKLSRLNSPQRFSPSSLLSLLRNIEVDISDCRSVLKEANERRRRHAIDDCRRSHDYDQFITAFLSMLAERGHLGDLLEHGISVAKKKYQSTNGTNNVSGNSAGGSEGSSDSESITKSKKIKAKKALMKKKSKAKGITPNSVTDNKQKSKGRGRPKKNK